MVTPTRNQGRTPESLSATNLRGRAFPSSPPGAMTEVATSAAWLLRTLVFVAPVTAMGPWQTVTRRPGQLLWP